MAQSLLVVEHGPESQADLEGALEHPDSRKVAQELAKYLEALSGGFRVGVFKLAAGDAAKASGTVTAASVLAADTITIAGVTLTAHASNQDEDEFAVGADDTETGDNIVSAIEANSTLNTLVDASNAEGVVTVTAKVPGVLGNGLTLASSEGTRLAVSGARLSGGAGALVTHQFGQVAS